MAGRGHSAPVWTTLKLRVPRGFEDFWSLICDLDMRQGSFTTAQVSAETSVQRQSVEHYVRRLAAGGFVELVEQRNVQAAVRENVYHVVKRQKHAPRVREDGTVVASTTQERLWCAMRTLVTFTTDEVAYAARVGPPVPRKTAQRYVNELLRAGYLRVIRTPDAPPNRPCHYRLMPSMNTGPLPPSVLVTEQVWDRNLKKIVGETRATLQEGQV